jgi:D-alanyl-D-alanine carboxypeptidase/D-alanyl-D-alanine-endopeptidase (penicillin-binding protein 4)
LGILVAGVMGGVARADLPADVQSVLRNKLLQKAEVSIEMVRLGASPADTREIYKENATLPLAPASNLKLITTSAALDHFGADFKFRTYFVLHDGNAIIWGDGDPALGDAEILRRVGWDVTTVFQSWAQQCKQHNITSVGDVMVDDSVFDQNFLHPNWPGDQIHKRYEAEVGGVNLNANCVDFYVKTTSPGEVVTYTMNPQTDFIHVKNTCVTGRENAIWLSRMPGDNDIILRGQTDVSNEVPVSVTITDPPMFAATVLAETLKAGGVNVTGHAARNRQSKAEYLKATPEEKKNWTLLAVHETPLPVVLARCNKDSMNLYAESLCKRLGNDLTHLPGSWDNGTAAVGSFLKGLGVADAEFHLVDGSGLSKQNTISSHAITQVLRHNFYSKNKDAFLASLSVAGEDGTLSDRFRGTDLRGRIFGKSGYISGVSSLSGYLKTKDNDWYVFSILMNGVPPGSNSGAKALQETMVKALDSYAEGKLAGTR